MKNYQIVAILEIKLHAQSGISQDAMLRLCAAKDSQLLLHKIFCLIPVNFCDI